MEVKECLQGDDDTRQEHPQVLPDRTWDKKHGTQAESCFIPVNEEGEKN